MDQIFQDLNIKRIIAIILLFLIKSQVFAQDTLPGRKFGLVFSPDLSYRVMTDPELFPGTDSPKFAFTAGLGLLFDIRKRIILETGLLVADKGFVSTDPDAGITEIRFRSYFIEVPVKGNYYLNTGGGTRFFLSAGLIPSLFTYFQTAVTMEAPAGGQETVTTTGFVDQSRFIVQLTAGLGLEGDLGDRMLYRVQPVVRQSFISISPSYGEFPFSAGLQLGIYRR